jgi:hypothetical protein
MDISKHVVVEPINDNFTNDNIIGNNVPIHYHNHILV